MAARIFALGFWRGETAYLRNNYNILDFLVVLSSWALKIAAWNHIYQPIYPGKMPLESAKLQQASEGCVAANAMFSFKTSFCSSLLSRLDIKTQP